MTKRIIKIGADPTGLGAAYRLRELGYTNWNIYGKNTYLGGHVSSHLDENGFVWDEGGHVIFSGTLKNLMTSPINHRVTIIWK